MGKSYKNSSKQDSRDAKNDRTQVKNSKKSKKRDTSDAQLAELLKQDGFEIHYMIGDGNCLFRSVAHQLKGDPNLHPEFRAKVIRYIRKNQAHFSLFLEDDEKFADYIERMEVIGEWGGHLELYAITQCCNVAIVIHQLDSPNYKLPALNPDCKTEIHLSYHGECHYNSVKRFNDLSMGVSGWELMDEVDELGSSAPGEKGTTGGKKKCLSVAAVATVSTRSTGNKGKKDAKLSTTTKQSPPPTKDIVTYETVKEDYVLVTVDHDESPITPAVSTDAPVVSEQGPTDALTAISSGIEFVCNAISSLTVGVRSTAAENSDEDTIAVNQIEPTEDSKAPSKAVSHDIITTRSGRPMSKKERRQYEKQMMNKKGVASTVEAAASRIVDEPPDRSDSVKKEIVL